ncbi:hypothetical protein IAG43_08065 [Streptomyces genisteinicus]|uniref:Uncharacterized protein n=1 Tax=Streptomyces genisteinicus TaxID=2768068 RepID=A0A7H0I3C9_9ACTN|nr:hypothetical protein [Streptomyces genisteinicus]QNP67295.1 hypothetical protein IAG43_08065 [Streptomyces genisteinicus]
MLLLPACTSRTAPVDPTAEAVRRTLDARADAVLRHDRAAWLDVLDPRAGALREAQGTEFDNFADVPFGSWEYTVRGVRHQGGRAVADAELRYRVDGYDTAPVVASRIVELAERDGRWYVTADRPGSGAPQQLWQQGDVEAVRGSRSLVLGVGQDPKRLRELAAATDLAVPAVTDAWPQEWAGRVVVLVPPSLEDMGRLLGAPAAGFRGIAAVTTGRSGGGPDAPADRVVVNPEAYGLLGEHGQDVVLTHETVHVATRAHTSAATPMWLSEGFADWVAYRGSGRSAEEIAPELRDAVRAGDLPSALPDDQAFSFGGDAGALARAYEGGWLACELIAERWGEERLTGVYRSVGAAEHRDGAVEHALARELGVTVEDFTAQWRDHLRERLG